MVLKPTKLNGAYLIEAEKHADPRGYFTTTFCRNELARAGFVGNLVEATNSFNTRRGTLRGLHFQIAPMAQPKIVRCTRGAIYDVIVDLRPSSPTFRQWTAAELTEENSSSLFVPEGLAHGFQTLADNSEVFYLMAEAYSPEHGRGVRWNDPAFGITWPIASPILAPRDAGYEDFRR